MLTGQIAILSIPNQAATVQVMGRMMLSVKLKTIQKEHMLAILKDRRQRLVLPLLRAQLEMIWQPCMENLTLLWEKSMWVWNTDLLLVSINGGILISNKYFYIFSLFWFSWWSCECNNFAFGKKFRKLEIIFYFMLHEKLSWSTVKIIEHVNIYLYIFRFINFIHISFE